MSVPTYDQFIEPILRFLAIHPEGSTASEAHEAAAMTLGLSESQRQETIASGQATYKNRSGWAHDRLKRAGYSSSAKRGYWQLTDTGRAYAQANPTPLSPEQVEHLAVNFMSVKLKAAPDAASLDESSDTPEPIAKTDLATSSPQERLNQAILELRASVAGDLLDNLLQASPTRFEHIVLDVLHSLGYGANRQALQQVGASGDGGIDGVISLDALGLEKVYVQAKRWQNTVGRPDLQAFYGALAGQKAKRGVFITTSGFTAQAVDFARSVEGLVLVDGKRLVNLMLDHEVGVSSQLYKVPRLDSPIPFCHLGLGKLAGLRRPAPFELKRSMPPHSKRSVNTGCCDSDFFKSPVTMMRPDVKDRKSMVMRPANTFEWRHTSRARPHSAKTHF